MKLSQQEHARRISLHEQGLSYKEIADAIGLTYQTIVSWYQANGFKAHKEHDLTGENERRYKAYLETNTDQQAADLLNMSVNTYRSWRGNNNLPANRKQKQRKDSSYVSSRPAWERDRMRHFGSMLNNVGHVKDPDVMNFIEEYRRLYAEEDS